jgi:uracil-DNA glycosylase family 4
MPWEDSDTQQVIAENPFICPVCGSEDCVPPSGDANSDVLFIGEFPGSEEIAHGKPFVGPTGRLLKEELRKLGLSLFGFRLCNLWQHEPIKATKKDTKGKSCFEHGVKVVLEEAKNKRIVVLVGSDTVKYFANEHVSEWNGLLVQSDLLKNKYVLAMVQPATAFRSSIGEVRFALKRFKYYLEN